jgi:hypothetical protein
MNKVIGTLGAVALGAAAMYVLDPNSGKRRRAMIKDKAVSLAHKEGEMIARAGRDLKNRVSGIKPRIAAAMKNRNGDDQKLANRVCSNIGRKLSHPGALEVSAKSGKVTLEGDVLASEVQGLLSAVEACQGVTKIDNKLNVHETAAGIPALQGEGTAANRRNWAPGVALAAGAAGAAAAAYGLRKKSAAGAAIGAAGLGLVAKSMRDMHGSRQR